MIEVLTNNHYDKILDLFESTNENIKIISPFISVSIAKKLCDIIKQNHNIKCTFITRFYLEDIISKANSIDAIEMMIDEGVEVYALKGLHTKLYLFDCVNGVLGSANFTAGGFISNIELSIHFENEPIVLNNLQGYFDNLLKKIKNCPESIITKDILKLARNKYNHLLSTKKEKGNHFSSYMFGASIDKKSEFVTTNDILKEINSCSDDYDIINDMFKQTELSEQINYNHTIWLKFHGESDNRMDSDNPFPMTDVLYNGKKIYLSNYPFKVASIKENDEVYLAALTTDVKGKNQPVIMGRGHLRAFDSTNTINDEWVKQYTWMERYPWYVVINDCKIIDTSVKNGVPLDIVWDELGSNTYISSFGNNESFSEVSTKHHQKAHIRLSGNAKQFIDMKLDELEKQYGVTVYTSQI